MLKPLILLVELLLVVDVIPVSFYFCFYFKADVAAFVCIGRCYYQCVADLF